MIPPNVVNALGGWGTGYQFTLAKAKEDEVAQGQNYIFAAGCQAIQIVSLANVILKITEHYPTTKAIRAVNVLSNASFFISLPICLVAAISKHEQYDQFADFWNTAKFRKKFFLPPVPPTLGPRAKKIMNGIATKTGDVTRVAMVVSSVALYVLGNQVFAVATLSAVVYQIIDGKGYVPRKISLFMEMYMPLVANIGIVIGSGSWFISFLGALPIPFMISQPMSHYIHKKIDNSLRSLVFSNFAKHNFGNKMQIPQHILGKGPTLEELTAPLKENRHLTFDEINNILEHPEDYEINPAHCSKPLLDESKLPKDHDFTKLLPLFNKITYSYPHLFKKLQDDERFIEFLKAELPNKDSALLNRERPSKFQQNIEKYPDEREKYLKESRDDQENRLRYVETCIQELARKSNKTKETFIADWTKEQMNELVQVLTGKKRVKGDQVDLDDAINNCSLILPFLLTHKDRIIVEDFLLKLAVEGGGYCARGIKGACADLVGTVLQILEKTAIPPDQVYEFKIEQRLKDQRLRFIQSAYSTIVRNLPVQNDIKADVHGFDTYRVALCQGMYPLTEHEKRKIDLNVLQIWECAGFYRDLFFYSLLPEDRQNVLDHVKANIYNRLGIELSEYRPYEAFLPGETMKFVEYIRKAIGANNKLTQAQKDDILEKYDEDELDDPDKSFQTLMLVMLGVLKKKQ